MVDPFILYFIELITINNINITNMTTEKMIQEMLHTGHLTKSEAQEWQKLGNKHVKVLYHAFYKLAVNK